MDSVEALDNRERRRFERARLYLGFLRYIIRLHPRLFATAVAGASVFALCTVASSVAIRWVIDRVILPRFEEGSVATSTVITGAALIIGIGLLRAAGVVVRRAFASMTQWRIAESLSNGIADRFVTQPTSWHQRQSDGQLLARGGVDVDTSISVMAPIPYATSTVLMLVVAGIWLIWTDTVMGLTAVAIFPVLIVTNVLYQHLVAGHFDDAQAALGEFSGDVHESFEAVQLVKAYGAEQRETDRLAHMADRIRDPRIKAVYVRGTFESLLEAMPALTNIGLVILGAARVQSGQVTIGELSSFVYMFTLLVLPLRLIGYALSDLPHSYAGYVRVRSTLDDPIEPDPRTGLGTTATGTAVQLDDVSFVYPGDEHAVIDHATATIQSGTVTAIVGTTGSGKTTLIDLISGLIPPSAGTVSVAPGAMAVVFQEAFLFGGSVRDNVAVDEHTYHDDQVWHALQLASADRFVRALPDGLDTMVGERGVTLSGGQRQRIALARALIREPQLLLLDDTTSALDPATEMAVLNNLRTALAHTTVVMVASRPSTISLADEVLFVDKGQIIDHGSHGALFERLAPYRALVEAFEADRQASTS